MSQNPAYDKLIRLLKELFQLDQPDLDFGLYRIMHAKAGQVTQFLEEDLLGIVREAFGEADEAQTAEAKAAYEAARQQATEYGAPDPDVTEPVKKAKAAWDAAKESGSNEGDVYDHLYRFFERYYDNGDFMSRRYFARETDGKAAPYAVPYDGREVYLHWANRDQNYIKTSEYLTNFTFDPTQAKEFKEAHGELFEQKPLKVHCRIVSASEGEHNNVKASEQTERYFIIHEPEPVKLEVGETGEPELVIQFQYRPDPEKTGQDGTWRKKRLAEAAERVKALLPDLDGAVDYVTALMTLAPTEADKDRTLLEKYLAQYTSRNTMDYFIHKDLGGFLRRELDFYIKNEIMRLDDIESADAPRVEAYLAKVKVLRRIAQHLIDFLAQLEDFQKRLWLKKKFVVDTQYCITLDRIPEEFYPEIAANAAQREEWMHLFSIDKLDGFSEPLTIEFLNQNNQLIIDTKWFSDIYSEKLISEIEQIDQNLGAVKIQADNMQALSLIKKKFSNSIEGVYIDPPYNTGDDGFNYKDNYKSSSWMSMQGNSLPIATKLLKPTAVMFASCDEHQFLEYGMFLNEIFGIGNHVETITWNKRVPKNDKGVGNIHEYIYAFAADAKKRKEADLSLIMRKDGIEEIYDLVSKCRKDGKPLQETRSELKKFYKKQGYDRGISLYCEIDPQYGIWGKINMSWPNAKTEGPRYEVINPVTGRPCPVPDNGWRWKKETFEEAERDGPEYILPDGSIMRGRIWYPNKETQQPSSITYLHEVESFLLRSIISLKSDGSVQLSHLGLAGTVDYPKPPRLIEWLAYSTAFREGYFLDYFAGSGTTGDAITNLNRDDKGTRKTLQIDMGSSFDTAMLPRYKKALYSSDWKGGVPQSRDGLSQSFKYLRLESYEDALNNLTFRDQVSTSGEPEFDREYMLRYWLDFETKGSPSLLNIEWFDDPTAYKLKIKKPGTDEYVEKAVDLVETFNWLIGLHVEHLDRWRGYQAAFKREVDPELPEDTNTRLMLDGRLEETDDGAWRFRKVEGYTLRTPGDHNDREKALVVWRKLTGDLEQDNLMLDEWFRKFRLSAQDTEFDVIYINGSNNLPNLRKAEETWKVRLIEEAFHQAMWDVEG